MPWTSVNRKSRPGNDNQFRVIEAQEVQDRRMQVVNVNRVLRHIEAEVIGFAAS